MADRPLKQALPADLPEDWTSGQIVAPEGADAGLSEQHGYNYLMAAVNAAQRAVNTVNESFGSISGKRTCRFVIGTSAAGWTEADCDYLCDGTDDQVEIQAAVDAAPSGGCEIVLLDGEYHLTGVLTVKSGIWLHGNGDTTQLIRNTAEGDSPMKYIIALYPATRMTDLLYNGNGATDDGQFEIYSAGTIENVTFFGCGYGCVFVQGSNIASDFCRVSKCTASSSSSGTHVFIRANLASYINVIVSDNNTHGVEYLFDTTSQKYACSILIWGNVALQNAGSIKIDTSNQSNQSFFCINNNFLRKVIVENSISNITYQGRGALIFGNVFSGDNSDDRVAISLASNTKNNFVFGNVLMGGYNQGSLTIVDEGVGNIIRDNSDDTGSGGSGGGTGTAGVSAFNGRSGAVSPQAGDYTAAMVGARPDTWTPTAAQVGAIPAGSVTVIQSVTQAEYDALTTKNATTLYLIKE